jgi:RNA polymerase sigma-70 factor (ECF subfamily)
LIYCVVPHELAGKLHDLLRSHFGDEPGVEVVVERRKVDRRRSAERRGSDAGVTKTERRRIRSAEGRRVADRRAPSVEAAQPPLPRRARPYADRLRFVERVVPTGEQAEDHDTARLVTRIQAGDREGYTELYTRYFDRVYAYLRIAVRNQHEAEDLTQQVFVNVLEALPRYERRAQPFRAWLFTIVRHTALRHLRRRQREQPAEPAAMARRNESVAEHTADEGILNWITDRDLLLFVERLPASQRQVLVMRYLLDLTGGQIAEILGTSPAAVRQLQRRAMQVLRRRLVEAGRAPSRRPRGTPFARGIRQSRVIRGRRWSLMT